MSVVEAEIANFDARVIHPGKEGVLWCDGGIVIGAHTAIRIADQSTPKINTGDRKQRRTDNGPMIVDVGRARRRVAVRGLKCSEFANCSGLRPADGYHDE